MIIRNAKNHFVYLIKSSHFLAFMILNLVTCATSIIPLREMCLDLGYRVSWAYFPVFISSSLYRNFLLAAVMLFADAPFISPASPYHLVRSSRRGFLAGQNLYIISVSIFHILVLFGLSFIFLAPYVIFINDWGKLIKSIYIANLGFSYPQVGFFQTASNIFSYYTPFGLLWRVLVMNLLQYAFLGFSMRSIALYFPENKYAHSVFALAYIFSPDIARAFGDKSWLAYLPASWFELHRLNLNRTKGALTPGLLEAWLILLALILITIILSAKKMKTSDIYDYLGDSK